MLSNRSNQKLGNGIKFQISDLKLSGQQVEKKENLMTVFRSVLQQDVKTVQVFNKGCCQDVFRKSTGHPVFLAEHVVHLGYFYQQVKELDQEKQLWRMDILNFLLYPLHTNLEQIRKHVISEGLANRLHQGLNLFSVMKIIRDSEYLVREHTEVGQKVELEVFGGQHSEDILHSLQNFNRE